MGIKTNVTTPLRAETYKSLQLNAGVVIVNTDISSYADAESLKTALAEIIADGSALLGATRGGGTFTITRDTRQVDADGVRTRFVGSTIVDGGDAYISTTLIEMTRPETVRTLNETKDDRALGDGRVVASLMGEEDEASPLIFEYGERLDASLSSDSSSTSSTSLSR